MSDEPRRWTQATVYPDMWADPDKDPREAQPDPEGEAETLHAYLTSYRLTLLMKCEDLSPGQLEQGMVDAAYANLAREQAATDEVLGGYPDLGVRLRNDEITVRELLVHRVEEYARHCGHADLLRERIDGRVGQ